jgi:hypothetical protein
MRPRLADFFASSRDLPRTEIVAAERAPAFAATIEFA